MTRIRFEDLPSTNTPRNAENLNKLNNVVISPTEPTTGEEVWIQKGKNLLDISSSYSVKTSSTISFKFESDKTYTISVESIDYDTSITAIRSAFVIGSKWYYLSNTNKSFTFTPTEDISKVLIYSSENWDNSNGKTSVFNKLQIELGTIATSYEPYTDKKIYTKNDNGVYEEFSQAFKMEEGSWTPTIGARNEKPPTTTIDYCRGYYKKIDKMVYVEFYLEGKITALNGTNNYSTVDGLPFPVHSDNFFGQSCLHLGSYYDMLSNANTPLTLIVKDNQIYVQANNGAGAGILKTTDYFMISGSGWYMID